MPALALFKKIIRGLWNKQPLWTRKLAIEFYMRLALKKLDSKRKIEPGDIVVTGLFGTLSGLGEGVRHLASRLRAAGLTVGKSNVSRVALLDDIDGGDLWSPSFTNGGVLILSLNPYLLPFAFSSLGARRIGARYVIGIWYWEIQNFPKSWKRAVSCVDEIWAGSRFVAEGLRKIAGSTPVHVVPLPLDVASTPTVPSRDPLPAFAGKTIVFFMYDVRSTHARKNPEGIIKAFRLAAENNSDYQLVIKINNTELWPESEARLKRLAEGCSNIHFMHEKLSNEDMKNLMARVDIVISLHRSEGFGLLMAEGMAAAKPVIATGWSANMDFMTPDSGILIDYDLVPVIDDQHGYDGLNAVWAEPRIEQAAEALRRLIRDPEERARLGQAARRQITAYLSPENWIKMLPESFWKYVAEEHKKRG
jgi:glycosyltransferase involved in cell wall biosynthesis